MLIITGVQHGSYGIPSSIEQQVYVCAYTYVAVCDVWLYVHLCVLLYVCTVLCMYMLYMCVCRAV